MCGRWIATGSPCSNFSPKITGIITPGGLMADVAAVKTLVNAARQTYSVSPLEALPAGERGNPCFCPIGRAIRKDMGDVFFVAVGTKHLRLASTDEHSREIAHRIRDAWGVRVKDNASSVAGEQFSTIPLPLKMREFVADFDAGRLPELEAHIGELEK